MVVAAYNPSTWDVEAGGTEMQGKPNYTPVWSKAELRPCLIIKTKQQFYSQLTLIFQLHWFAYTLALAYFKSRTYILFFYTSPKTISK